MLRRNRDISIFSLSMLDVFCGALGAFLIVMIILLPFYKKESIDFMRSNEQLQTQVEELQQELSTLRQEMESLRQQLAQAEQRAQEAEQRAQEAEQRAEAAEQRAQELEEQAAEAEALRQELAEAEARAEEAEQRARRAEALLNQTFLLVYIRWETANQDVDLHVIDPSGAEFYYEQRTIAGRPGELAEDSQYGPGNEVWEVALAPAGEYRIDLVLYDRHGNAENPTVRGKVFHRDGSIELPAVSMYQEQAQQHMTTIVVSGDGTVSLR